MPRKRQTEKHAKELKRVRQFISRAEGRGYRFPDELKDNLYDLSTQKLKSLKPRKLYEMATAIDEETGEILTGPEKRRQERSLSAALGALTKKIKGLFQRKKPEPEPEPKPAPVPEPKPPGPGPKPPQPPEPQPPRPPEGPDTPGILSPAEADIIIQNLIDLLRSNPPAEGTSRRGRTYRRSSLIRDKISQAQTYLYNLLMSVIARDGKDAVARRLSDNAGDISAGVDMMRYSSSADAINSAMTEVAQIINGDSLTLSQMQEIGEMEEYGESWELPD